MSRKLDIYMEKTVHDLYQSMVEEHTNRVMNQIWVDHITMIECNDKEFILKCLNSEDTDLNALGRELANKASKNRNKDYV